MVLSEMARKLEMAGKDNDMAYIEVNFEIFINNAKQIKEAIEKYLKIETSEMAENEDKSVGEENNDEDIFDLFSQNWIDAMVNACDDMDSEEIRKLIDEFKKEHSGNKNNRVLADIEAYAKQYEFDEIVDLLQGKG